MKRIFIALSVVTLITIQFYELSSVGVESMLAGWQAYPPAPHSVEPKENEDTEGQADMLAGWQAYPPAPHSVEPKENEDTEGQVDILAGWQAYPPAPHLV